MKKIFFLFVTCIFFISIHRAIAQDPYARLKQTAAQNPVLKENLKEVVIPESDSRRKVSARAPIAFKPFDMVDKTGRKISPDENIDVNGKNEKAKVVFDRLNEIEREQNAKGYSIKNDRSALVIDIVTPASELDGKVAEMSANIGRLKSESEINTLVPAAKQVSGLSLNPFGQYNAAEKARLAETKFSATTSGVLSASTSTPPPASNPTPGIKGRRFNTSGVMNPNLPNTMSTGGNTSTSTSTPVKLISETSTKEWSFGAMSTFKAGVKVDLLRAAKIYPYDPQSPGKSMSEFKVSTNARVYAGLFGNSMDLLSAGIEFYAPADSSKQMTAKGQIQVAGITVMSLNESITQAKTYGKSNARTIDKSFPITVPICCGISFSGKIGVKGEVGLNYNGGIYRTVVNLQAGPVIDLKGYIETGVSLGGVAKLGVGGELTFIKGNVPASSYVGIWAQSASQIVVGYNYYLGYDLSVLSGRLYGYADVCVPVIDKCHRLGEVNFFSWGGFKSSGTIAEGGSNYVINL